jgi:NitT/TauT family transport system ATP-binding protein
VIASGKTQPETAGQPEAASLPGSEVVLEVRDLSVMFLNGSNTVQPGQTNRRGLEALQGVSFDLHAQEFACLLGPSGSGKSTLLRAVAGLVRPTAGEVIFPGRQQPRIGLVFQDANLMPWRTVIENVMLPLTLQEMPKEEAHAQAQAWIERVGLKGFENAWPANLSGGMAQRVAIARALIQDPDLLLLDEPFGALDALTREKMGTELLNLWQDQRKTVLMVTHSISEALLLSDRVLVFSRRPGRISLDLPVDLQRPRVEEMRYTSEFGGLARRLKAAIQLDNE